MNLFSIIVQKYIEINFVFYAYAVGYLYIAIVYLPSLIIPPLKRLLSEFEESGTNISALLISLFSGSFLYILFLYFERLNPITGFGPLGLFLLFIGYWAWGFFALFLLTDYRNKFREKRSIS